MKLCTLCTFVSSKNCGSSVSVSPVQVLCFEDLGLQRIRPLGCSCNQKSPALHSAGLPNEKNLITLFIVLIEPNELVAPVVVPDIIVGTLAAAVAAAAVTFDPTAIGTFDGSLGGCQQQGCLHLHLGYCQLFYSATRYFSIRRLRKSSAKALAMSSALSSV